LLTQLRAHIQDAQKVPWWLWEAMSQEPLWLEKWHRCHIWKIIQRRYWLNLEKVNYFKYLLTYGQPANKRVFFVPFFDLWQLIDSEIRDVNARYIKCVFSLSFSHCHQHTHTLQGSAAISGQMFNQKMYWQNFILSI
jgi:hypothetical protein